MSQVKEWKFWVKSQVKINKFQVEPQINTGKTQVKYQVKSKFLVCTIKHTYNSWSYKVMSAQTNSESITWTIRC